MKAPNHASTKPWWTISVSGVNLEEVSYLLFDAGILGVEIKSPSSAQCYFTGDDDELTQLKAAIERSGLLVTNIDQVKQENWCERCAELWEPMSAGNLRIIPVANEADTPRLLDNPDAIYIIPGMGFGTGHHDSTRMALELLQNARFSTTTINSVLDLGTGSGILAIACARLFSGSIVNRVLATDIDFDALENAKENIKINNYSDKIAVEHATLAQINGTFNLIVANIYAEVLCELQTLFHEKLTSGGMLLLSGIMTERLPLIEHTFSQSNWKTIERRATPQWHSLLLEKH